MSETNRVPKTTPWQAVQQIPIKSATIRQPETSLRQLHDYTANRTNGDCKKVKVAHKGKGSPYSITDRRVPELIPVLCSQPAGDVSHKPGGRLPLLSASYPRNPQQGCYQFRCLVNRGKMGVNSLPKIVTRQRGGCDLNPGLLRLSPAR